MVVNGANWPDLRDMKLPGMIASVNTLKKAYTTEKRLKEQSYLETMKKAAGEHYRLKQEREDGKK